MPISTIGVNGLLDASVTNAKLVNGYPNLDVVAPTSLPVTNGGSANTWYNIGSIQIPSAGVWRIFANLRWADPSAGAYVRVNLATGTTAGSVFSTARMQFEQLQATAGNLNIGVGSEWYVTFGTGITYPYSLYIGFQQGNGAGAIFLQNDVNGISVMGANKIASTTSTGSSPVQLGS